MAGAAGADTMTRKRDKEAERRLESMNKAGGPCSAGDTDISPVWMRWEKDPGGTVCGCAVVCRGLHALEWTTPEAFREEREELYDAILEGCLAYGIGMADHQVIDEINILQATKKAMREAIARCEEMLGGLDYVIFDAVTIEDLKLPQEAVVKGDAKVLAVAAASIVAKVTRDRMMVEYSKEYPGYAFESNKGYGTAAHYRGIREQGICPIHRKTFLKSIH